MKLMFNRYNRQLTTLFFFLLLLLACVGCPSQHLGHQISSFPSPEEKVYSLSVGNDLQVPIEESEAMVYRFDAQIERSGLYQFETTGKVDTLCALVHGQGDKEQFVLVRDIGGTGENCKLVWTFQAGFHQFKVRVDGRGHFYAKLRRIPWGQKTLIQLRKDTPTTNTIEKITDRHQFKFALHSARLVQLEAKGNSLLQCILRREDGRWLTSHDYRQPYGSCSIGRKLPKGNYLFELRSNRPQTKYTLQFQQIRMQDLPSDRVKEGFLRSNTFDVYQVQLGKNRQQIIQSFGNKKIFCTLEQPLGHIIVPHSPAPDKRNCLLEGEFPSGTYFLRVALQRKKSKGLYQISFRQRLYKRLFPHTDEKIFPRFQSPFQLYRLEIPQTKLYQIEITGRPIRCSLESKSRRKPVTLMNLSEPNHCLLFTNLSAGAYFLRVVPTTREEKPYQLKVKQYKQDQSKILIDQHPKLIGPVAPRFTRTFQFTSKQPELLTIETRGKLDTACSLYDDNGTKIAHDDDSGKRLNCQMVRYLKPGSYRLKVRVGGRVSGLFWVQRSKKKLPWLRLGKRIKGILKGKKRPHTFMLKVKQTGLYGFRTESQLDTICRLLNTDWQQIAKDDDSGEGKNCFIAQLLTPGIYSMQVRLYRRQKGFFHLRAYQLDLQQLQSGKAVTSQLSPPGWMTFYRAEIKKSGLYSFETQGKLDTKCALLNSSSKRIATNDDINGQNKNCQMIENLQPGIYFFQVWLYKDNKQRMGGRSLAYKALYHMKKAVILSLKQGKYIRAKLQPGSITRFLFHVTRSGMYQFETKGELDPKCALFNPKKQRIAKDDDTGQKRNCRIKQRLQKGTYEFQVRPATTNRNKGFYHAGVFKYGH